jgi:hypothetical protein
VRTTAAAIYAVVGNLMGLAVGPVVTGVLADRWDLTTALTTVAATGLGAGLAFWWGSRSYHRDRTNVGLMLLTTPSDDRPGVGGRTTRFPPRRSRRAMTMQLGPIHDGTPQLGLRTSPGPPR